MALLAMLAITLLFAASAHADAPLSQGFEDGAPAWSATGMWHVQANPQTVSVIPAIRDQLVTLPDAGALPPAVEGSHVAWFGESSTGTYCGSDFATLKQTPNDGCTSTHRQQGTLTSPSFSLAGRASAYLVFRDWWEIEAVNADITDLMTVEYSTDDGTSWHIAGLLNPLDPAWGGRPQSFTDGGARESGAWQTQSVDLSAAAGSANVRVRFVFDTRDQYRNGFRGLLLDGLAVIDPLGATIDEPQAGPFTDAPPSVSVDGTELVQSDTGDWSVDFHVVLSHPTTHDVGTDWTVTGADGTPVATGHVIVPAGSTDVPVAVPVSGGAAPYTVSVDNPTGATIAPGGGSSSTPGGSLPLVGIDSVGAAGGPDGTATVSVGVKLSEPAPAPVSVDYTATGSDGVLGTTGTLSVPTGGVNASTTVSLPGAHAPYTIGLSNARGALLDPSSSSATTSPLAAVTSVSVDQTPAAAAAALDPGSQLVLGVRIAAGDHPTLYSTFFLSVGSGTIRYHLPNGPYKTLTSGTVEVPLGSVVDATDGHAVITVESDASGTLQQIEIWDGKAGVFQYGSPAITELRLAGGDFGTCASGARHARKSGGTVIRKLWAQAKGRFRTKGRYGAATIRGTSWLTEDLCLATRFTVAEGIIGVTDFRRKTTVALRAGQTLTISPLGTARYRHRTGLHGPRLSRA